MRKSGHSGRGRAYTVEDVTCIGCGEAMRWCDECDLCEACCECDASGELFDADEMGVDPEGAQDDEIRRYGA